MRYAIALLVLSGCGSEPDADADVSAEPQLEATLVDIHQHVLEPGCAFSGCHAADSPAGELDLSTPEAAHANLVGVEVVNELAALNGWQRVTPGDPDLSFLMRKLEGPGPGEGSAMPNAMQQLDPFYMDLIRQWIEEGANP